MPERWLSVDENAAHLGVNPDRIYKWIARRSMSVLTNRRLLTFRAYKIAARCFAEMNLARRVIEAVLGGCMVAPRSVFQGVQKLKGQVKLAEN